MNTLTVGQTLFWVDRGNDKRKCPVTVTKVGRKWAELSNKHRIDIETLHADAKGFSLPGTCWLSEAEYVAEVLTIRAHTNLKNKMGFVPNKEVKIQDIYEAARLLRITL